MGFEKLQLKTCRDLNLDNVRRIGALFPDCVIESRDAEGRVVLVIDFEVLKSHLSKDIITPTQPERYQMNWPGKAQSRNQAYTPIDKTIRPVEAESKDFATTENIFIEGDNLDVLKLLQESYLGKIKMIYIDPPYNTGNDFIYKDNRTQDKAEYDEKSDYIDENGGRLVANPQSKGRYHSDWLSMIYPRLLLARNLLRDDGVIFISIDDNEQANLKKVCDEVFGEENFVGDLIRKTKSTTNDAKTGYNIQHENTLIYAKNKVNLQLQGEAKTFENYKNPDNDPNGDWAPDNPSARGGSYFEIKNPYTGKVDLPPINSEWRFAKNTFEKYVKTGKIKFKKHHTKNERGFIFKRYKSEVKQECKLVDSLFFTDNAYMNQHATKTMNTLFPDFKPFDYTKPHNFIKKLIQYATQQDDIILDFFAGSGTTAHAVMALNAEDGGKRTCISVQLPELTDEKSEAYKAGYTNIAEITKERIRRAGQNIPPPPRYGRRRYRVSGF